VSGISRGGQHLIAYQPKSIVVDVYLYEDTYIQHALKLIEVIKEQTGLDREVKVIVNHCERPALIPIGGTATTATLSLTANERLPLFGRDTYHRSG
jgi:hypothetical protein